MRGLIFYNFFVCCIIIEFTKAAPTTGIQNSSLPENTFLTSIKEKCYGVVQNESITKFTNPQLQKCVNWTQINSTTVLDRTTEQDVLCLLYHDSFISFCDEMKKYPKSKIDTSDFDKIIKTYTTKTICDNGVIPVDRSYEHILLDLIKQKETCYKLCGTYNNNYPVYECAFANYVATLDFHTINDKENVHTQELSNLPSTKKESNTITVKLGNSEEKTGSSKVHDKVETGKHQEPNSISNAQENVGFPNNTPDDVKAAKDQSNVPSPVLNVQQNQVTTQEHHNPDDQENKIADQNEGEKETQKNVETNETPDQSQHGVAGQENKQPDSKQDNKSLANHDDSSQNNQKTQNTETHNPQADKNLEQIQDQDGSNGRFDKPDEKEGEKTKEKTVKDDGKLTNTNEDSPAKKESTAVNEEEGDTKVDDVAQEVNQFQETDAEESIDPDFEARPDLPLVDEKPQLNLNDPPMVSTDNVYEIDGDSYFFSYFMVICVMFILGYVGYHNRLKVMALVLEGKRNKRQYRGRRPNSANYHKLDSNLEEAISSNVTKNSSNVIY
ncbi:unnamed protein product [Phaedon cochleariae]|uniref:Uncharacterized protein n=1 Tax=Phaedon cochleariae TaxID=80249 RepID=A0A9P0DJI5_PHACE|nr:unnamed protein product [Phaedon cochleariae]